MIPKLPDDHKTAPIGIYHLASLTIDERVPEGGNQRERAAQGGRAGSSMIISRRHLSRRLSSLSLSFSHQIVDYHWDAVPSFFLFGRHADNSVNDALAKS